MSRFDARFADYVTRVSFNLQLSKEMVTALAAIDHERRFNAHHYPMAHLNAAGSRDPINAYRFPQQPAHVVGNKGLESRGLITWTDPGQMEPKWSDEPFKLTPAGEHVLALLKIAGLVVERPVAANEEKPRVRRQAGRG